LLKLVSMNMTRLALGFVALLCAASCEGRAPVSAEPSCEPGEPRSIGANPFEGHGVMVNVAQGLRADLEAATGQSLVSFNFDDKVEVQPGYGVDLVFMLTANIGPAPGADLPPDGTARFLVFFGGHGKLVTDPDREPHPEYAAARALFDSMTKVPERQTAEGRVRQSPNGRVVCSVPVEYDGAHCQLTGVQFVRAF
jgi:hypothetical protein